MFTVSPILIRQVVEMVENYADYVDSPDGLDDSVFGVYNYFDDGVYIVRHDGDCAMINAIKLQKIDISATRQEIARYQNKTVVLATYNDKALSFAVGYVTSPFCDYEFNCMAESHKAIASALADLSAWVASNVK